MATNGSAASPEPPRSLPAAAPAPQNNGALRRGQPAPGGARPRDNAGRARNNAELPRPAAGQYGNGSLRSRRPVSRPGDTARTGRRHRERPTGEVREGGSGAAPRTLRGSAPSQGSAAGSGERSLPASLKADILWNSGSCSHFHILRKVSLPDFSLLQGLGFRSKSERVP